MDKLLIPAAAESVEIARRGELTSAVELDSALADLAATGSGDLLRALESSAESSSVEDLDPSLAPACATSPALTRAGSSPTQALQTRFFLPERELNKCSLFLEHAAHTIFPHFCSTQMHQQHGTLASEHAYPAMMPPLCKGKL